MLMGLVAPILSPEELYIQKQQSELFHYLLDRLSVRNRAILLLHYFEGLSYEEIAKNRNVPIGTVKAQLHRAREALALLILRNSHVFLKNRPGGTGNSKDTGERGMESVPSS